MALLDDMKLLLRIGAAITAFNTEINDLIAAAKDDLQLAGVTSEKIADDSDPLIKRAISAYVKANFGYDNSDADRLQRAYDMLKMHLTLAADYSGYSVTFTVTDGVNPLEDARIEFNGEEKYTDVAGQAVFTGLRTAQNLEYTVTLDDYNEVESEVDVTASTAVSVELEAS